jgi:glycine betaine/proline transport system ATP-binding protein
VPATLRPFAEDMGFAEGEPPTLVLVPPELTLSRVIDLRYRTGCPVVVAEAGRMLGVIGDDQIYAGLLHQTRLGREDRAHGPGGAGPSLAKP